MDMLLHTQHTSALYANHAKSCYDQVVHNITSMLAMHCVGVPTNPIKSMFGILQAASHKIRIAFFGISDRMYGHGRDPPIHGFRQGNCSSPAGWALVSTPLINIM
jgi:hypothetical protein